MKRKYTYLILSLIFCTFTAFIIIRYKHKLKSETVAFYPLKERKGASALLHEYVSVRANSDKLIRMVREKPEDIKSTLALASLYLQEARISGDYTYYNTAALKYIDDVLKLDPQNFNGLVLKGLIQLSQHHFTDALETAGAAVKINPYNAFVYGIMVDGNVEMGNYADAVKYSDKMMSIRPDMRSYARVAYLREIHGDLPGAIEAMNMAVESGAYGDESTEWCRVQMARLYEITGKIKYAEMHYTIAQNARPGYAYALAGLSRIAAAQNDYEKAITLCQTAIDGSSGIGIKQQLANLYLLTGKKEKADALLQSLVDELTKAGESESGTNHHTGMELANIYLLQENTDKALEYALKEYSRRPENIDVAETAAWANYKTGNNNKALILIQQALRTNCQNPLLLCHAGIVYAGVGEKEKAKTLLQAALKQNPVIDIRLKQEATAALNKL